MCISAEEEKNFALQVNGFQLQNWIFETSTEDMMKAFKAANNITTMAGNLATAKVNQKEHVYGVSNVLLFLLFFFVVSNFKFNKCMLKVYQYFLLLFRS
jgi:hypothetical protein